MWHKAGYNGWHKALSSLKENKMARVIVFAFLAVSIIRGPVALAEDAPGDLRDQVKQLQDQVKTLTDRLAAVENKPSDQKPQPSLEERVADLEKKLTDDKSLPKAGWDGKFFVQSADGAYRMNFGAITHFDGRFPANGPSKNTDAFLFRRIRASIDGFLAENYEYKMEVDFANNTAAFTSVFLNFRHIPNAQVKVGNFTVPFSAEELTPETASRFIEKSVINTLAPKRRLGVMVWGKPALHEGNAGVLEYSLGAFNGREPGNFMPAGRLALDLSREEGIGLLRHFTVGANAAVDHDSGAVIAGDKLKTDLQTTYFEYAAGTVSRGNRTLEGADLGFWRGPFGFMGEYIVSRQELANGAASGTIANDGWYTQAGYVLTGEDATIKGVKPKNDFNPSKGGWGAVEIAARYAVLNVDPKAAASGFAKAGSTDGVTVTTAGANWYLNKYVRLMLDYVHSEFNSPVAGDRGEDGVMTRVQLAF